VRRCPRMVRPRYCRSTFARMLLLPSQSGVVAVRAASPWRVTSSGDARCCALDPVAIDCQDAEGAGCRVVALRAAASSLESSFALRLVFLFIFPPLKH
jgi:hypothetical protein